MLTNPLSLRATSTAMPHVSLLPWCIREGNRDGAFPEGTFFLRVYCAVAIEPFL